MSRTIRERAGLGVLCAVVLAAVPWASTWVKGPLAALERFSLDARMRSLAPPGSPSPDIAIIRLDDQTLDLLEPTLGAWPWRRDVLAEIIDFAASGGAKAIVVDMMFLEPDVDHPAGDRMLIESTRRAGNVYHVVGLEEGEDTRGDRARLAPFLEPDPGGGFAWPAFGRGKPPFPGLAEASRRLAAINLVQDPDGVLRKIPTFVRIGERTLPTVSWALARDLAGVRAGVAFGGLPLDGHGEARLLYFPETEPYERFSLRDVLSAALERKGGARPAIAPERFADRIVFVGYAARGLRDEFDTPIRPPGTSGLANWPLFGVEIHAEAFDLLRQGRLLRSPADSSGMALASLAALALILAGVCEVSLRFRPAVGVAALFAGAGAILAGTGWVYRDRLLALPVAAPLAGLAVVWGAATVRALVRSLVARRHVQDLFGRYLAPAVVKRLVESDAEAAVGGTRRTITVLFSDIRGFTSWSEQRTPEAVVRQLNEYLSAMSEVVAAHGGYVDKFIGDAVMALWGVPIPQEDHADRGLAAARAMLARLETLNRSWEEQGLSGFRIGIGLNSGEAIVGNLGSVRKADYTAIGDPVNTASRLEGMNKEMKTVLLVSRACLDAMREPPAGLRSLGSFPVRGREARIEILTL